MFYGKLLKFGLLSMEDCSPRRDPTTSNLLEIRNFALSSYHLPDCLCKPVFGQAFGIYHQHPENNQ